MSNWKVVLLINIYKMSLFARFYDEFEILAHVKRPRRFRFGFRGREGPPKHSLKNLKIHKVNFINQRKAMKPGEHTFEEKPSFWATLNWQSSKLFIFWHFLILWGKAEMRRSTCHDFWFVRVNLMWYHLSRWVLPHIKIFQQWHYSLLRYVRKKVMK